MNLSIRHMKAFMALAKLRNFTRAAESCSVTQSAFSALIANLESDLEVRLFARNTRNVDLTAEGQVFLDIVSRLLPETERALGQMKDYVKYRKGKVAVAALPSIASSILPPLIARFAADFAGIDVAVQDVSSAVCVDMVRNRQVDLALCAAVSPTADLAIETLTTDAFYFICLADHPLATRKRLSVPAVIVQPIIAFEPNSSIRQHLDAAIYPRQWVRLRAIRRFKRVEVTLHTLLDLLLAPLDLAGREVAVSAVDSLELAAADRDDRLREQLQVPAQDDEAPAGIADGSPAVTSKVRDGLEVRRQATRKPHQLHVALALPLEPPA